MDGQNLLYYWLEFMTVVSVEWLRLKSELRSLDRGKEIRDRLRETQSLREGHSPTRQSPRLDVAGVYKILIEDKKKDSF